MTKYFLGSLVTMIAIFFFAKFLYKEEKIMSHVNIYRYNQSKIHHLVSPFLKNINIRTPKNTQSKKHFDKTNLRVIVLDGQAFWIKDNVFYTAEVTEDKINQDTTTIVDTMGMDKVQLDKMLFIIDQLRDGKKHDSGSTGN